MADAAPDIIYSIDRSGDPVALVERQDELGRDAVLEKYPDLMSGAHTTELARLINHFTWEFQYEVIDDPKAFVEAYKAQLAAEDTDGHFDQNNPRLRDFGMPDFGAIAEPKHSAGTLTFYARNKRLGIPYVVTVEVDGTRIGEPDYQPVAMSPFKS